MWEFNFLLSILLPDVFLCHCTILEGPKILSESDRLVGVMPFLQAISPHHKFLRIYCRG